MLVEFMVKKQNSIKDFVAEQNRLTRTGGLPKNHPNGRLAPCDIVMSPEEKKFWELEDQKYQDVINDSHK